MAKYKNSVLLKSFLLLALIFVIKSRKLLMIQQLFRHGARYPITPTAGDYSDYTNAERMVGELTLQGRHMHYILGKMLYKKYWNQLFGATQYAKSYHPSQILIMSTAYNRTIESAQAQVVGLLQQLPPLDLPADQAKNSLPPNPNAQSFNNLATNSNKFAVFGNKNTYFHTVPIHGPANFLIGFEGIYCPNQNKWMTDNLKSSQLAQIKNSKQVKSLLIALRKSTGLPITYQQIEILFDDYVCAKYLSKKYLPLFDNQNFLKTAQFIALANEIVNHFYTETQRKAGNTVLLQNILSNMNNAISNKGPKIVLYSAHDSTLISFGTALNFTNIDCVMSHFYQGKDNSDSCINQFPKFASNYLIELWQEDDLSHTIKILYNGVYRKIPICGYKASCNLEEFKGWAQSFYATDVKATCGIDNSKTHLQRHHLGSK